MDGSAFCPNVEVFGGPEVIRGAIPTRLADVLRPACRALPLAGRRRELDTLLEWLERGSACIRVVAGPAGAGKSRLLAEVAALSQRRFVVSNAIEASEAAQDGMPLVVMTRHMRVTASDAEPVVIEALGAAERAELFEAAYRSGASRRGRPAQPIRLAQLPDESPEALIMAGLIAPDIGASAAIAMAPEARAARIAADEADTLDELARRAGLDPWPVRHIAACLTHRGGASVDEAIRLVERESEAGLLHSYGSPEQLVDILADLLLEDERLRPVADGAVGRAFVQQSIACHDEPTRVAILARAARLPDCFAGSTLDDITATDRHASCHFALESPA